MNAYIDIEEADVNIFIENNQLKLDLWVSEDFMRYSKNISLETLEKFTTNLEKIKREMYKIEVENKRSLYSYDFKIGDEVYFLTNYRFEDYYIEKGIVSYIQDEYITVNGLSCVKYDVFKTIEQAKDIAELEFKTKYKNLKNRFIYYYNKDYDNQ